MREASDQYGPLVRIDPNDILCTDPDTLRRICGVRSTYTKGDFYETRRVIPGHDNIVTQRDETKRKALRAKLIAAYSGRETSSNAGLEVDIDDQVHQLITLIDTKYTSKPGGPLRPLDLCDKAQFFTFDVISAMSFGKAFSYLTEDKDLYQFLEINASAVPVMNFLLAVP